MANILIRPKGMHRDGLPYRIVTYLAALNQDAHYRVIATTLRHRNPRTVAKMCSLLANRGLLRWTNEGHYCLRVRGSDDA